MPARPSCRVLAIALLGLWSAAAAAVEAPVWSWLPHAADDDRSCELHLAAGADWRILPSPGLTAQAFPGELVATFVPGQMEVVTFAGPDGRILRVRPLAPGRADGLTADADGRLRRSGDAAILAVPRREALADRRWGLLRMFESVKAIPCRLRLDEPPALAAGLPALTRQIAAAQALRPTGEAVLVVLSGDDRFAGWKHREYRQALAWLVADLTTRGATHVVLVQPCCPAADAAMLAPFRAEVRDVAAAFRCQLLETTDLDAKRWWEVAPDVLGPGLNAAGRGERERLLRPWLGLGSG